MLHKIRIVSFLILAASFCSTVNAQVEIFSKNSLEKIKGGNTHVIVNDLSFNRSSEFYTIFKKYWTVTKSVEFLKADDLQNNLVAGDTYFSLENLLITSDKYGGNSYFYLNLWMPDEKVLKKGREFKITNEISIAHIQISVDAKATLDGYMSHKNYGFDFDGGGHIFNWNPGILKNYLQQLSTLLQKGKKSDFRDDLANKDQLHNLSSQTLYCSEDNFHKIGVFMRGNKNVDPNEVFEAYKYKYKILKKDELEDKILADEVQFFYLLFLRNSSSKMVAVVNSRTGEIIYNRYKSLMAFILKSGDLKSLSKAIK
ncbi:hypothetical protein [Mucilaginibacter sp.]|uniref:hypothetical protein n=1 Tax=Mucilaginibacter sp. TaxID=1882438 RepID=UPI002602E2DC|nr:hypothetical protein [Mucilaginibacter sp.]